MYARTWRPQAAFCLCSTLLAAACFAAPFTPGNVVVYRVGDGAVPLDNNGNVVFLEEYSPVPGPPVQVIAMPTSAVGAQKGFMASGTATSEGWLTRSVDGTCLVAPGYGRNVTQNTNNIVSATGVPRVVAVVNALGAVDTSTALNDASLGSNFRGSASTDCASFWVSGTQGATGGSGGGARYATFGATSSTDLATTFSASVFTNLRAIAIYDGQLFITASVTNLRSVAKVGVGVPTSGPQTLSTLPGLPLTTPSNSGPYAFFLTRLSPGQGAVDTLYIANETVGLQKFSLVGSSWAANGVIGVPADVYRGITGVTGAGKVTLYATRRDRELVSIVDNSGFNGALTASPTTLATASPTMLFRGVAMAPQITVTPTAGVIPHGSITPNTPQIAGGGTTQSFTLTPDAGFSPAVLTTPTSCGGGFTGNVYTTNPLSKNCTVDAAFVAIPTFVATPVAGPNGTITPNTPRTVLQGATTSFTINPSPGYSFAVTGCGGTLAPNSNVFTTAPMTADCTVTATFTLITFTVTPSAGANGSITPATPQTIPLNTIASFDLAPEFGFGADVGGTCGGTRIGTHYTTSPITADCTVVASFPPLPRYAVTPTARGPGSITPAAPQTIIQGQTATFNVNPDAGYNAAVRGTCGGSWSGNTYTTKPVAGDCALSIVFARKLVLFVGNSYTFGRVDPVMSYNAANVSDLTNDMWLANPVGTNAEEPHPWGGIPGVFKKLADQSGLEYDVSISARNAASLRGHYLNSNPAGWDLRGNVASQRFDVVMLQDLSDEPLPAGRGANANLPFFDAYVDKLERWVHGGASETYSETQLFGGTTDACRAITGNSASQCDRVQVISPANANARAAAEVYLYSTWARPDMIGPNGTNADGQFYTAAEGLEAMTADLHNAYFSRAVANGHIEDVAPVGDAFLRAVLDGVAMRDPYVPEIGKINLWHTDYFHPSKYGSYLSALVHFQTISGINPLTLGPNEQAAADLGIPSDVAVKLQRVAQKVVLADTVAPATTATLSTPPNAAGWNRDDVTVSLSATDTGGSLLDSLSYTLTGAQTGTSSFASSGSVTITAEGVTTLTYYATDRAGNTEASHTLQVSIDKTAPVTVASATPQPNAAGWNRGDVTVTFNAADSGGSAVESIAYALSGAQTSAGTLAPGGAVAVTAQGVTTITYFATDRAGNAEAPRTLLVSIDKSAPMSTATASPPPNAAGWNRGDVTVTFNAADSGASTVQSIAYALSGAQTSSGTLAPGGAVAITAQGVTTITYFATDRAGNVETTRTLQISIDKTAPVSTAVATPQPNAAGWNRGDVAVALNASDAGGSAVEAVSYTLSGAQAGAGSVAPGAAIAITAQGVTTINYFATDRAGNTEATHTLQVSIDRTAPVSTANATPPPNAAGFNAGDVTVSLAATDAGGSNVEGISYTLSGAQTGSGSFPSNGSVTITSPGTTTLTYFATDRAGNAQAPQTLRVAIDKTGPVITGMPAAPCSLWPANHKMVTVATVSASDGGSGLATFEVTATSSEAADPSDISITGAGNGPRTVALRAERLGTGSDRIYTITASAVDDAGNATTAVATCTVPHNQ